MKDEFPLRDFRQADIEEGRRDAASRCKQWSSASGEGGPAEGGPRQELARIDPP